jgi:hypothetical protein
MLWKQYLNFNLSIAYAVMGPKRVLAKIATSPRRKQFYQNQGPPGFCVRGSLHTMHLRQTRAKSTKPSSRVLPWSPGAGEWEEACRRE